MNNSKYTPGPWFANQSELLAQSPLVSIRTKNGAYEIVKGVAYENARLIAAAPEMLEAVTAVVEAYKDIQTESMPKWFHLCAKVKAQAEGK